MRHFLMTSPAFEGHVNLIYDGDGAIQQVDFTDCTIPYQIRKILLERIANFILLDQLPSVLNGSHATVVEKGYEVTFEQFWAAYPLHRNAFKARQFWSKMDEAEQVKAFMSLKVYKRYLDRNKEWLKPMLGDRYLRTREYETEWHKIQ
jgi:hypothetical protein